MSPLLRSILFGNQRKFLQAASAGEAHIVQAALNKGADIEARYSDGYTALMSAADHGHTSIVQLLLSRGANVDARCNGGQTALHWAVWNGHLAAAEMLLKEGKAQPNCIDNYGITPFVLSAYTGNSEAYRLMLAYGAREEPEIRMLLAAAKGDTNSLLSYLENGGDPNGTTSDISALFAASYRGQLVTAQLLIERGADVNLKDKRGTSPIMTAAREGHVAVVKLLLDKGADPNGKNKDGESAISRAAAEGHAEIEAILKRAGARV